LFELGLGPVALAFATASTPEHQRAMDVILEQCRPQDFPIVWLKHQGLDWAAELAERFSQPEETSP
jgi:type IV secretion system protein VirB4